KNIIDLTDDELDRAKQICAAKDMEIISIASPLLKCVLPGTPEVDSRFQQDMFAAKHNFEDQPLLTARAFEIAHRLGARIIRVFSYWRSIEPEKCFDGVVTALRGLAEKAAKEDVIIGLENEHACNIATGMDTSPSGDRWENRESTGAARSRPWLETATKAGSAWRRTGLVRAMTSTWPA